MRKRLADFVEMLPTSTIDLGSNALLPGDYVAGHALGFQYNFSTLPDETRLRADLQMIVRAYRALTYRGGVDADSQTSVSDEFEIPANASITEIRRYSYHRKIERNRAATRYAKKFHGTQCQACGLDFAERYGVIGKGFIEAHHLRPISTLEEGVAIAYDIASDFAVLCSNCHRMIHRFSDPSDLPGFRTFVHSNRAGG